MILCFGLINTLCANQVPSVLWCCWLGGRKGIRPVKKLSGGVLVWLSVWSEVQTCIWPNWCHCHSLSLASVKSRLVSPIWYRLTRVVPDTRPLNRCKTLCVQTWVSQLHLVQRSANSANFTKTGYPSWCQPRKSHTPLSFFTAGKRKEKCSSIYTIFRIAI